MGFMAVIAAALSRLAMTASVGIQTILCVLGVLCGEIF